MTYQDREESLPKPYAFVPLPRGKVETAPPAGHHRYEPERYTGFLTAQLVARSPVHVASGLLEKSSDRKYPLVKAHFRSKGVLTLPGASLKGCIRSIVEAITHSSVQVSRARVPGNYRPPRLDETDAKLDVAQRLFGAMGYQGCVRFGDAPLVQGKEQIIPTMQLFAPRPSSTQTYYDGSMPKGRKFYMHGQLAKGKVPLEVCPEGCRFDVRVNFEQLSAGELGVLLFALGLGEPRLWPKLGGSKPSCLGTVEVVDAVVSRYPTEALYSDFDVTPQVVPALAPLLQVARDEKLVRDTQLRRLAEVLQWPAADDRQCPDRNY